MTVKSPVRTLAVLGGLVLPASGWAVAPPSLAEIESALRANNAEQLAQTLQKLNQATEGDRAELNFQRGLIHLKRESYEAAMASFAAVPVSSTYYLDARNNMAAVHAAQGRFSEAKATLEAALKANQSLALVHKNLDNLRTHLASKSYASALQVLDAGKDSKLALVVSTGAMVSPTPVSAAAPLAATVKAPAEPVVPKASAAAPASAAPVAPVVATAASAPASATPSTARSKAADKTEARAVPAPDTELTNAAVQALHAWVQAWERKDMERYFKSYAPEFTPPDGKTREQWVQDRRTRILSKDRIHIQIKQIDATLLSKTSVRLRYRQLYQADQLKIASDKTVEMKWGGQQWLIASERAQEASRK